MAALSPAPRRSWRWKLLAAAVVTVGVLGVAEAVLRVVFRRDQLLLEWERPDGMLAWRASGEFSLRPGAVSDRKDGPYPWHVAINQQYFREDEPTAPDDPTAWRVLALGDSWVFGWSTTQGKTLCDDLEGLLTTRLGREVDVLDMGQFGASAFDMYRNWRAVSATYHFDAVLLGRPHNEVTQRAQAAERATWLTRMAPSPTSSAFLYLAVRRALYQARAPAVAPDPGRTDDLATSAEDIVRIVQEAQASGKAVWLVDWPTDARGRGRAAMGTSEVWKRVSATTGVPAWGHTLGERSCWGFDDYAHPSEAGAMAVATMVARHVADPTLPAGMSPEPSCDEVPGVGPGKDGWPEPPIGNGPPHEKPAAAPPGIPTAP